jgi:hypothetical protein
MLHDNVFDSADLATPFNGRVVLVDLVDDDRHCPGRGDQDEDSEDAVLVDHRASHEESGRDQDLHANLRSTCDLSRATSTIPPPKSTPVAGGACFVPIVIGGNGYRV